jgi:cytochrome d ubiquinol oxidase subunit II
VILLAAAALFSGILLYALFGGADFGAGFWDLTAGGARRGREPRALIDQSLGPVWEANHVWLIYCLVVAWTAFPVAFAAVMTSLYIPLGLAALGIVLRGSAFAFRKASVPAGAQRADGKASVHTEVQRAQGATFAASSVVTPFFLGTVAGGVASGRVPTGGGTGPLVAWLNPTGILAGIMAVAICAYLAAVFLTAEARLRTQPGLEDYFRLRSILTAAVAGAVALGGIVVVKGDAPHLFDRLLGGPGLPLVLLSAVAGLAALVLLRRGNPLVLRVLAAAAVGAVVVGWAVAQYPYLLGDHLTITEAAAPGSTLRAVIAVFLVAGVLCLPSLALLYLLQQRGHLDAT